jgi:uncharacterized protein YjiS (DUF1127 family)
MNLQAWLQHWQQARRNRRDLRELNAFSAAERRHLAQDVGLPGTDLRRFNCTHNGPTELMPGRDAVLRPGQAQRSDPGHVRHRRAGNPPGEHRNPGKRIAGSGLAPICAGH